MTDFSHEEIVIVQDNASTEPAKVFAGHSEFGMEAVEIEIGLFGSQLRCFLAVDDEDKHSVRRVHEAGRVVF